MSKQRLIYLFLLLGLILPVFGCQNEPNDQTENTGVEFNDAYRKHFGELPPSKAGQAYAHVAYLPLKERPGKVGALPIFFFSPENRLEKVLQKVISGDLTLRMKTNFYNPFPPHLSMASQSTEDGTLSLNLNNDGPWSPQDQRAAVNALKETALQFGEIEAVKVSINTKPLTGMPANGYGHEAELIADPPPASLILMAGAWEADQTMPEEVLIEFDRPVKIKAFKLFHQDGRKVAGDYFTSIFHMAVVIHPTEPDQFKEGTMLKAEWHVVDFLGRESRGSDIMPLQKYEH